MLMPSTKMPSCWLRTASSRYFRVSRHSHRREDYGGGRLLVPGFIDLQVNGGDGIIYNDKTDFDTLEIVCSAQMAFGTTYCY